jgi:hypothetical protein
MVGLIRLLDAIEGLGVFRAEHGNEIFVVTLEVTFRSIVESDRTDVGQPPIAFYIPNWTQHL